MPGKAGPTQHVLRALRFGTAITTPIRGALAFELLLFHLARPLVTPGRQAAYEAVWGTRALVWEDILNTPADTRQQALARAARKAARDFRRSRNWGTLHRLQLAHPFGLIPFLGRHSRFADVPACGTSESLLKTAHGLTNRRHRTSYGSVARHISDLADPDANDFVLVGGQDGWLGSDTAVDQLALWQRGEYIRLPLQPETARKAFLHRQHFETLPVIDATLFLKLYARRRGKALDRENLAAEQERQLLALVRKASNTRFGSDHGFSEIGSIADYQARVPLRRYEDMWRDYWQPAYPKLVDVSWPGTVPYFALSSGTTSGTTKYIPCTHEMNRSNDRAALDVLVHHLRNRPKSHVLGGKSFMLGGSTELTEVAPGIYAGDLSGIAAGRVPVWARSYMYPPCEYALIADWEKKIELLSRGILDQDIRVIAGTPSWLLIFFERLFALKPEREPRLQAFFPHLELIIHGGVNFAPYRQQFEALLAGSHAETREVYPASEGFIAAADRGPSEGLRPIADNGLFFEFVPVDELGLPNATRHWLANVEFGVDYAVVVTTCAGLWGYVMGDTVKFVARDPPRLLVSGRTSYYLSSFGEHLTGEDIEEAVAAAAAAIGAQIADFSVGAIYPNADRSRGGHLYIVEFNTPPPGPNAAERFLEAIDQVLLRRNDDYRAHRSGGFGLDPPQLLAVKRGTFEAWMKARGQLGGQHKVPRVIANPELFELLRRFACL